jgi:hypothetical protein
VVPAPRLRLGVVDGVDRPVGPTESHPFTPVRQPEVAPDDPVTTRHVRRVAGDDDRPRPAEFDSRLAVVEFVRSRAEHHRHRLRAGDGRRAEADDPAGRVRHTRLGSLVTVVCRDRGGDRRAEQTDHEEADEHGESRRVGGREGT